MGNMTFTGEFTDSAGAVWNVSATASPKITKPVVPALPFQLGVYKSAQDPQAILDYEAWLGRPVDKILDTIPSGDYGDATLDISWQKMVGSGWGWFASKWAGNESRMVVTIPMLPTQGNYGAPSLGATAAGAALASGAAGAYDNYWVQMRQNLINSGYGNNVIRLGWEMNGGWYNWSASFNPTAWVTYFQRIVGILRADPKAHFVICFNPTMGYQSYPADQVYPGDAYVDAIGLDVYDQDWNGYYPILATDTPAQALAKQQAVWTNDIVKAYNPHDMLDWSNFAKTHGKPFMICEWGCMPLSNNGGGDNPFFVQSMYDFASNPANGVTLLMYFDLQGLEALYNSAAAPTQFPNASALYLKLFGAPK
jgi:hypothetical protein